MKPSTTLIGAAVLLLFQIGAADAQVSPDVAHQLSLVLESSSRKNEDFPLSNPGAGSQDISPNLDSEHRRRLNAQRCKKAIRARCGRKCKGKCLNACYMRHMAFFNDIKTCVTGQNVLRGAVAGKADFDRDGIKNNRDEDDDNDGIKDSEDDDVSDDRTFEMMRRKY